MRLPRAGDVQRLRMRIESRTGQHRGRHADQVGAVPVLRLLRIIAVHAVRGLIEGIPSRAG
jgi:hypothetical protein